MLEINQVFNDKYRILKVIGQGGMGRVYLAEHVTLKNRWAVKEMLFDANGPVDLLAEPNILKQLDHPALPKIVDILEQNNTVYIFMDYIDGMSLKQALKERKKFSEKEVVDFGKQLAEVFIYLHNHKPKPIIYRDMKPDNVMLTKDGKLKVIDFGIAREFKEDSVQDTVLGFTRGYAAPEQQNKEGQSDARTDIYSLGVTLYHLVTGKSPYEPPYDFTKIREIDPSLSEGIETIIRKCVQPNPDDRYQSAAELLNDLNNIHKLNSIYKKEMRRYYVKKTVSVVLFLFSVGLTVFGFQTMAKEKQALYMSLINDGIALVGQHKFEDGISKFKQAQEKMPKSIDSYREIAKTYLLKQEYDTCINYIENEVFIKGSTFADDEQLLYILGTAYFNQKQYQKSSVYFRQAALKNSAAIPYKRDLAVSLGRENKISEAEEILKDIKNINGDESVTSYVQGEINSVKKNYADAVKNFEEAINISRDDEVKLRAYKSIAKLYGSNPDKFPNAIERQVSILEKASNGMKALNDAELTEMMGNAYSNMALSLRTTDKSKFNEYMKKALNSFQNLIDAGYKMPNLYANVGAAYHYIGDYANSEKTLQETIKLFPEFSRGYAELALLYITMEMEKPRGSQNYSKVIENYNLALKYSKDKDKDPQLRPLITNINVLKSNGLIK